MKTLVFALVLETLVDGYVDTTKEFGVFQDIDHQARDFKVRSEIGLYDSLKSLLHSKICRRRDDRNF